MNKKNLRAALEELAKIYDTVICPREGVVASDIRGALAANPGPTHAQLASTLLDARYGSAIELIDADAQEAADRDATAVLALLGGTDE